MPSINIHGRTGGASAAGGGMGGGPSDSFRDGLGNYWARRNYRMQQESAAQEARERAASRQQANDQRTTERLVAQAQRQREQAISQRRRLEEQGERRVYGMEQDRLRQQARAETQRQREEDRVERRRLQEARQVEQEQRVTRQRYFRTMGGIAMGAAVNIAQGGNLVGGAGAMAGGGIGGLLGGSVGAAIGAEIGEALAKFLINPMYGAAKSAAPYLDARMSASNLARASGKNIGDFFQFNEKTMYTPDAELARLGITKQDMLAQAQSFGAINVTGNAKELALMNRAQELSPAFANVDPGQVVGLRNQGVGLGFAQMNAGSTGAYMAPIQSMIDKFPQGMDKSRVLQAIEQTLAVLAKSGNINNTSSVLDLMGRMVGTGLPGGRTGELAANGLSGFTGALQEPGSNPILSTAFFATMGQNNYYRSASDVKRRIPGISSEQAEQIASLSRAGFPQAAMEQMGQVGGADFGKYLIHQAYGGMGQEVETILFNRSGINNLSTAWQLSNQTRGIGGGGGAGGASAEAMKKLSPDWVSVLTGAGVPAPLANILVQKFKSGGENPIDAASKIFSQRHDPNGFGDVTFNRVGVPFAGAGANKSGASIADQLTAARAQTQTNLPQDVLTAHVYSGTGTITEAFVNSKLIPSMAGIADALQIGADSIRSFIYKMNTPDSAERGTLGVTGVGQ